jgi:hypothetical protein
MVVLAAMLAVPVPAAVLVGRQEVLLSEMAALRIAHPHQSRIALVVVLVVILVLVVPQMADLAEVAEMVVV